MSKDQYFVSIVAYTGGVLLRLRLDLHIVRRIGTIDPWLQGIPLRHDTHTKTIQHPAGVAVLTIETASRSGSIHITEAQFIHALSIFTRLSNNVTDELLAH